MRLVQSPMQSTERKRTNDEIDANQRRIEKVIADYRAMEKERARRRLTNTIERSFARDHRGEY